MGIKHTLTIPGWYHNIKQICEFVASGARESGLTEDEIFKLELACDEACTNIIEHAYGHEGAGEITTSWENKDGAFTITLHDNGRSFDPDDVAVPAVTQLSGDPDPVELKVGGLGIHFMRNLMDEIRYRFDKEQGNTLVMVKYIGQLP
ncbi:MAG: ATP-binding protein [Chloroflexota bacterium]